MSEENTSATEYPQSFNLELYEEGESDAKFRTENDPKDPDQRSDVITRKGLTYINCTCKEIIHGYYSTSGNDLCTILVFSFRFEPLKNGHRIKHVEIQIVFSSERKGDKEPEVDQIYPEGYFSVNPTLRHEKYYIEGGGNIGFGPPVIGEIAAEFKQGKEVEKDTTDHMTVQGIRHRTGRNYGGQNSVYWCLRENETERTGVPTSMQAVVRLRRKDASRFQAHFTITAKPDWLTSARSFLKSIPNDDPVYFDPFKQPTSDCFDTDNLGGEELEAHCSVTVATILNNSSRERN